jgi:hypothetical protein
MAISTKQDPAVARNDVAVKLDADVVREARIVAAYRGIAMAEYISEILRPIVHRDLEEESRKALGKHDEPRPKR